jgi:hypothetical protein
MAITRAQQARQMLKKGSTKPVVQGGVDNYLGDQPQVVVPRKWQSGPDKPPTELAYITEAEKKLLLKEDIHGSLKDGPNEGPGGVMSLDSFGDIDDSGKDVGMAGGEVSAAERGDFSGIPSDRQEQARDIRAGFVAAGGQKTKEEKKDKGFQRKVKEIKKTFSPLSRYNRNQRKKYLDRIQKARINELNAKLKGLGLDFYGDTEETYGDFISQYAPSITEFGPKGTDKYSQQFIDDVLSGKRKPPESFAPIDIANVPGGLLTKGLAAGANIFGKAVAGPTTYEELMDLYSGDKGSYIRARDFNIDDVTVKEMMKEFEPNRFKLLNPEFEGAEPDPCKGPNPPAYCFTGIRSVEPETTEPEPEQLLTSRILGTQFAADGGRAGYRVGGASGREYDQKYDPNKKATDTPMTTSGGGGGDGDGLKITPRRIDRSGKRGPDVTTFKERKPFDFVNFSPEELVNLGIVGEDKEDEKPLFADASLNEDEKNIQRLLEGGSKTYKDTIKKVIDGDTVTAGGEVTGTIPDLSNPDVLNKIAIDLGLPTQKQGTFIKKDIATPETASAIKEIQNLKRNLEYKPSEVIDIKSDLEKLKDLSDPQIQSIYDMVSLPGQNRFTAAGGGIASLDREAFLLGGLAKGLKKAVRGIKKLAKSPIGKAALVGAGMFGIPGTSFGGIFGKGALSKIIGQKAMTSAPFAPGTGILGFMQANPMATIFGVSALAGLTAKKDEGNEELEKYLASQKLDPSLSVRGTGSEFDFYGGQFVADGGRIGYQEGSKEPVAKKTLPLIDMDGMEKDYRETGGFVEMGRMEKADDVPARLSKNEFVFTADAVRNAGEGDIDKGAEVMYNMMKNLEAGGEVSEESQGLEGAREMFQTSQRLGEVI